MPLLKLKRKRNAISIVEEIKAQQLILAEQKGPSCITTLYTLAQYALHRIATTRDLSPSRLKIWKMILEEQTERVIRLVFGESFLAYASGLEI